LEVRIISKRKKERKNKQTNKQTLKLTLAIFLPKVLILLKSASSKGKRSVLEVRIISKRKSLMSIRSLTTSDQAEISLVTIPPWKIKVRLSKVRLGYFKN
jgi:hypothetical protein